MALKNKLMIGTLAALALMATTAGAFAATAYATTNVNVRSGPGPQYRAVDVLQRGEAVDVQYCRGSWCLVDKYGSDGWVSANYLDRGGRPPIQRPAPLPDYGYNDYGWNDYGWYGNRTYPRRHYMPAYPRSHAQACFGDRSAYFCFGS